MPEAPKQNVRLIQFQMATDPVTGGSFQITANVPGDCDSTNIAKELGTLREAGYFEMAASNRRRLEHERIVATVIEEKISAARTAGKHIKNEFVNERRSEAAQNIVRLEAECAADDEMLMRMADDLPPLNDLGS